MASRKIAEENYFRFCQFSGNECIASEFALITILEIVKAYDVKSVLEIGMGIGSIADTVLKYSHQENLNIHYYGTEANHFCNEVLPLYVESFENVHLFSDLSEINRHIKFDLIIIDGQDKQLKSINNYCSSQSIVFIEGDRSPQRELVMSIFPKAKHVNVISLRKNREYAHGLCKPEHFVGGGQLIFTNPSPKMKYHWLREKVKTRIIRNLRKLRK